MPFLSDQLSRKAHYQPLALSSILSEQCTYTINHFESFWHAPSRNGAWSEQDIHTREPHHRRFSSPLRYQDFAGSDFPLQCRGLHHTSIALPLHNPNSVPTPKPRSIASKPQTPKPQNDSKMGPIEAVLTPLCSLVSLWTFDLFLTLQRRSKFTLTAISAMKWA